jgi:type I restriction enzyme S subunit
MIADLKPYSKYNESGLPWLGQVPGHWEMRPAFGAFVPNHERNRGMKEKTVLSLSYGRIIIKPPEKLHGLVPESFETYQIVNPGDIVLRTTDLQNDHTSLRVGMVHNRGIITSAYLALCVMNGVMPDFGFQFLNVWDTSKAIYGYGSGLRQNLGFSHFKRMPIPLPPPTEQAAIVRFLDWANGRLERAIRAKRKVIALLNEQKQAIIHRAVTRGLPSTDSAGSPQATSVPLKPSGIPWLGDIPKHWEVRKIRTCAEMIVSNVDKHSYANEKHVRLCNYTDVYKNERITNTLSFMRATATDDEIVKFRIRLGDVVVTKDSEEWDDIGVPSFVAHEDDDLVCGYHLAILRPRQELVLGVFLLRALQDRFVATQMHVRAKGVTRYGLSRQGIKDVLIPLPPTDEQASICTALSSDLEQFAVAISRLEREIELLREYRTRLVADVVTGKLDVRKAAARLPEEATSDIAEVSDESETTDEEIAV